jgi:hypothetical protein
MSFDNTRLENSCPVKTKAVVGLRPRANTFHLAFVAILLVAACSL